MKNNEAMVELLREIENLWSIGKEYLVDRVGFQMLDICSKIIEEAGEKFEIF